jgi:hypothetical protein
VQLKYNSPEISTNSPGKIDFYAFTVPSFAFSGFTDVQQGYRLLDSEVRAASDGIGYSWSGYTWEAALSGVDSSGGSRSDLFIRDSIHFFNIHRFSSQLKVDQMSIPTEFEKVFSESFWDILA